MKQASFALAFSLLFVSNVNAQMSTVSVRAGANLAHIAGTNLTPKDVISFQFGFIVNVPINPNMAFQPGLVFTGKGTKSETAKTSDNTFYQATSKPYYVEIPANLVFKTGSAGYTRFCIGAGPYLGIGVAGKVKNNGMIMGSSFQGEKAIKWSNEDPSTLSIQEGFAVMKRFDYGVNATAGIETFYGTLSLNYGLGLASLQNTSTGDDTRHRVLSLTLGIRLGAWNYE